MSSTNTRHGVSVEEEQLANASSACLNVSSVLNVARAAANAALTSSAAPARCAAERTEAYGGVMFVHVDGSNDNTCFTSCVCEGRKYTIVLVSPKILKSIVFSAP